MSWPARWLNGARRLRERGILGINRRNAEFILDGNPRPAIELADDKLRVHRLCASLGVPTPRLFAVVRRIADVRNTLNRLANLDQFVIKPARGSGGRGVIVNRDRAKWSDEALAEHLFEILSGIFSLGGQPDVALIQELVPLHPRFESLAVGGIPDVRVIVHRQRPIMAMLRLPTRESNGRANLHQGGLGVGIEIATGQTHHAVQGTRPIRRHSDNGADLLGVRIPMWDAILEMSCKVSEAVGLGYSGIDIILDPARGPLLLEVNARPGLAIQNVNGRGLLMRAVTVANSFSREASLTSRARSAV